MTEAPWDLVVAGPAHRTIDRLRGKIALAVLDYLVGPPLDSPHPIGKPLQGELVGLHSARVGAYRIVYEIDHGNRTVRAIYIDHRADVYRPADNPLADVPVCALRRGVLFGAVSGDGRGVSRNGPTC